MRRRNRREAVEGRARAEGEKAVSLLLANPSEPLLKICALFEMGGEAFYPE